MDENVHMFATLGNIGNAVWKFVGLLYTADRITNIYGSNIAF